jgi:hypothetical protein
MFKATSIIEGEMAMLIRENGTRTIKILENINSREIDWKMS